AAKACRLERGRLDHPVPARRVADADHVVEVESTEQLGEVAAELLPADARDLVAPAVAALIDCDDAPWTQVGDDLIPAAGVKAGCVHEHDRIAGALASP